jgi:hypothetical protein
MNRVDAYRMIRRRTAEAGLKGKLGCHVFRATGITPYLEAGGTLENAQAMAAHESPRTTKLYDRTGDEITLDRSSGLRSDGPPPLPVSSPVRAAFYRELSDGIHDSAPAGDAAPLFFIACIVFMLMDHARSDATIVRADPAAALRFRRRAARASLSFPAAAVAAAMHSASWSSASRFSGRALSCGS